MSLAEGAQFGGQGEGDHEVRHGQEPGILPGTPDLLVKGAALWAGAMVATMVGEVFLLAVLAVIDAPSR